MALRLLSLAAGRHVEEQHQDHDRGDEHDELVPSRGWLVVDHVPIQPVPMWPWSYTVTAGVRSGGCGATFARS